jgi:transcriptional regulator with XRE-family HTH domain
MPENSLSFAPPTDHQVDIRLGALGRRLRARRQGLRVSAVATAEAAGISRVTLHRIERGEPSVAMASYMSVISALGLRRIAWQRRRTDSVTPAEALSLYERNWRHVDAKAMAPRERELVHLLAEALGGGALLV